MSKKISIQKKPEPKKTLSPDSWVSDRGGVSEENLSNSISSSEAIKIDMKRFTIDVPSDLHRTIKKTCAERGTKMADEIRDILSKHYQE